jgi:hypothetical protein
VISGNPELRDDTMKKLRLTLEDLSVESFQTAPHRQRPGTVAGHGFSDTTCHQIICDCHSNGTECQSNYSCPDTACDCPGTDTCGDSCGGTCDSCDHSCGGTCDYDSFCLCTEPPQIVC